MSNNCIQSMFNFKIIFTLFSVLVLIKGIYGFPRYERHRSDLNVDFEPELDPFCTETPDSGSGHQFIHMWYFNVATAQCRELLFRGLGGSNNMFATRRECERRCLRHYTEGAEQFGPKIKAAVEHRDVLVRDKKFFSHRLIDLDQKNVENKKGISLFSGHSKDPGSIDYPMGGNIDINKKAPHQRSLTPYDDEGTDYEGLDKDQTEPLE